MILWAVSSGSYIHLKVGLRANHYLNEACLFNKPRAKTSATINFEQISSLKLAVDGKNELGKAVVIFRDFPPHGDCPDTFGEKKLLLLSNTVFVTSNSKCTHAR